MNEHFILTFSTAGGRSKQIRVPEPHRALSENAIRSAAGTIIDRDVFTTNSGPLVDLTKVEYQQVTRTKLI